VTWKLGSFANLFFRVWLDFLAMISEGEIIGYANALISPVACPGSSFIRVSFVMELLFSACNYGQQRDSLW